MTLTIALDAMGGDHGPEVTVPAALDVLKSDQDLKLILVGDQETLMHAVSQHGGQVGARLSIQHASQQVEMDELPSQALRGKRDSSMRIAVNLVKDGSANACVSAGNTGALMAISRFVLKTLPGVERPAIVYALPTMRGHTHMLDLGANVDSSSDHLFQFAVMGAILANAVDDNPQPTIGLLNIGEEEIKGNERVKEAARLLADSDLNYRGYVEGDDIFKGSVDVVVCDGFVGNVALKTTEGVARMITQFMKEEFTRSLFTRLAALCARPVLKAFRRRVDPGQYNGATLLGLQGIVVKSHGSADIRAFANAVRVAAREVNHNVPRRIGEQLENMLVERHAV